MDNREHMPQNDASASHFYLTTTLPYVNADPHVGFALEMVQADIIVRYQKLLGKKVFFNTGTDEHGLKIHRKALEQGKDTQAYVDEYAAKFRELMPALGVLPEINFVRTTDAHHKMAAQEIWRRCLVAGDIYKKNYQVKYCVGCELEKTDSELDDNGCCLIHPNLEIEIIEEENYFFRWSKYQSPLLALYSERPDFVIPDFRFNEIKAFVERGLEDFSISRLKSKMPWGVPVPDDDEQVMYVWFDALTNYISVIGWPDDLALFNEWWPGMQIAGKDNLRQQSAMWQAMLLSAGLPPSKQILIHGFITSGGQKMSKSLGNVINPYDIVAEYGTEALRYYLARHIPPFEDGDFTMEKFKEVYNANLANGLGNLVSRVLTMSASYGVKADVTAFEAAATLDLDFTLYLDQFQFHKAADYIWYLIQEADRFIQTEQPFKKIKVDEVAARADIEDLLKQLYHVATLLAPILPVTSENIITALRHNKPPEVALFPRKD